MAEIILILGGARSGKSTYAEKIAAEMGGDSVLYVATAEAKDDEMRARIIKHQSDRPAIWQTLEAPKHVGAGISEQWKDQKVILLDCLTMLVSNILLTNSPMDDSPVDAELVQEKVLHEMDRLVESVADKDTTLLLVSNEVGLGLVPPYELGRVYRDVLGRANQHLALKADEVFFLVSGLPMKVK